MKNVVIFHGSGTTPDAVWHPYIKTNLAKRGYDVSVPVLTADDPAPLDIWLPLALKENYNNESVIVGHSSGAPLILSVLEKISIKVKQAILIAGFITPLPLDKGHNPILQDKYN